MYLNITKISKDKNIQDSFTDIIQSIINNYAPQKIVLFGSYARGEAHEGSDIDLMVIKESSKRFIDRIADVIQLNKTLLTLESMVYSPLEFETMKKEKRDFIMTIEEEGIEIYDERSGKMAFGKRKIITHSTYILARECMQENNSFNSILSFCAELDKHYITSRYPNGIPDSTPSEVYLKQDALASINNSQKILECISQLIKI